jgi:hypothetical protein
LRSGYLYLEYEATSEEAVLLDASGHTKLFVNGMPHEGDHYDYGWSLIPLRLRSGTNTLLLTGGRFPKMRARLLTPESPIQLTLRDMTLPDILLEDNADLLGGIRIINSSNGWFSGQIVCELAGATRTADAVSVSPLNSRKGV